MDFGPKRGQLSKGNGSSESIFGKQQSVFQYYLLQLRLHEDRLVITVGEIASLSLVSLKKYQEI